MNSLILTSLAAFFKAFGRMFKESCVCKILLAIYGAFSNGWKNSCIMRFIGSTDKAMYAGKSVVYKIFRLPAAFWESLQKKTGAALRQKIDTSVLCAAGRCYVNAFMAVNTRFWGALLLCACLAYTFFRLTALQPYSVPVLAVGALGAVLLIFKRNLMAFLNGSRVVDFVKAAAGFKDLSFEFYDEKETNGKMKTVLGIIAGLVTGAAMFVSPLIGLAFPFAVFGAALVLYAPVTGVYAAVFLAPIVPTMALAGVCIWTGISFLIYALTTENFKIRVGGVGLGLMLLLAVLFVSSAFSFAVFGSLKVWAMYFVFVMFYFVIINTVKTKDQLYGLLKVFVFSGAIVALYGLMQYVFGWTTSNAWIDETMFEDETMRVYSTLANPNVLGEYLLLVLPVCAVFMIKFKANTLAKWAYLAMFALLGVCLVLTQSRGCWLGFMLAAVIFVTFYEGRLWGLVPIVLVLLPFVLPETVIDRVLSIGNMEDSSTSYRVYIWLGTLGMLKTYWLGGIGMGEAAFSQVYPFFSYNAIIAPHSHNTFLQLTVEAGIGALAVFVITQFVFAKKMVKTYRLGYEKSWSSTAALAIGCGVIAFLTQSMFDYTFYNYRVMALFFMVMAMGMSLKYIKEGAN